MQGAGLRHNYRIGWFSTGRDKAARDLLAAVRDSMASGYIPAEIAFVFCSREKGEAPESDRFIKQVNDYGIPLVSFSYDKYRAARAMPNPPTNQPLPDWRLGYDREVMQRLERYRPDLGVLAGYMLIAGPELCRKYDIINLHPALPGGPTGTWQEVIRRLIGEGAKESGVMMHLVTPELDRGPVVSCCKYPIRGGDFDGPWTAIKDKPAAELKEQGEAQPLFARIREEGLKREFPLIIATIRAFARGTIRVSPTKGIVDAAGNPVNGCDMTGEINELLRG